MGLPSSIQRLTVHESGKITSVVCRERADKEGWDLLGVDSQGLVLSEMSGYQSATLRPLEESEWFVQSLETVEIQRKRVDEVVEAALSHHELGAHDALSAKEREIFSGLKTEKRKQEWFAGRLVRQDDALQIPCAARRERRTQRHFTDSGHAWTTKSCGKWSD